MTRRRVASVDEVSCASPPRMRRSRGRYGPDQTMQETLAVDDVMLVIEGSLSVTVDGGTVTAGPGEIIYMPKGEKVTIRSHADGAITAYVTYPHWQDAPE
jgi:ethanolamine utilization protein EutQ (cupin superfamily)